MKNITILYHMARADFLERIRRYSFMMMLGLVVWLGYASASQQIILRVPPDYVGEINSHWIGALMAMTATLFLGWFGFYLVKGSVARDYETGVGQIMATTPLTRPMYVLGKWLSNFAVLGVMLLILLAAGVVMNLLIGARLNLWAIAAPLLLLALPCMGLIAALAVLFETISWLRGGFGNVVYFFVFMLGLIPGIESDTYQPLLDFAGFRLLGDQIAQAAKSAYPESQGGFAFSITDGLVPRYFPFAGLAWTGEIVLYRLFFLLMALGLVLLAALFFDRFKQYAALLVGAAAILLTSAYQFTQVDAKTDETDEYFFKGFPSYWNVMVIYMLVMGLNPWINLALLTLFNILVFVPVKYIYPSRNTRLRRLTLVFSYLYAVVGVWSVLQYPDVPQWAIWASFVYVAYYVALSLWPRRAVQQAVA